MAKERILITPALIKALLPKRSSLGHKGSFGSALVIAGSRHFTGAAYLAGAAALRGGAGLVYMAVPRSLHSALAGVLPEAIWELLPEDESGNLTPEAAAILPALLPRKTAILIGPGLGRHPRTETVLNAVFTAAEGNPLVIDADGLQCLAQTQAALGHLPPGSVLTPHLGEMSALTGLGIPEIEANRPTIALNFAIEHRLTLVLKGPQTLIATPEGHLYQSDFASSALAHGGSGDVLAGLLTGLLAQGISPTAAAICAVWLHAQAALLALKAAGWEGSVLPSDLLPQIGKAVQVAQNS